MTQFEAPEPAPAPPESPSSAPSRRPSARFDLAAFLDDQYGERCPDYEPGCAVCEVWRFYDVSRHELTTAIDAYTREVATVEILQALERKERLGQSGADDHDDP